jgi:hypothetical protein
MTMVRPLVTTLPLPVTTEGAVSSALTLCIVWPDEAFMIWMMPPSVAVDVVLLLIGCVKIA